MAGKKQQLSYVTRVASVAWTQPEVIRLYIHSILPGIHSPVAILLT